VTSTATALCTTPTDRRSVAVIDTQSVLDWQFFTNPLCKGWTAALEAGHWCWLASPAMRGELAHVLGRGLGPRWPTPAEQVLAFFDRHALLVDQPQQALAGRLVCSDPDDQKFIDLALVRRCRWLVSRDRAVLRLRRRAFKQQGLIITPPADWRPEVIGETG
jgi:predicted nucleic acid-binding protein